MLTTACRLYVLPEERDFHPSRALIRPRHKTIIGPMSRRQIRDTAAAKRGSEEADRSRDRDSALQSPSWDATTKEKVSAYDVDGTLKNRKQ